MKNLDELMKNRKLLDSTGRSELLEIIGVLLDERQVFMENLGTHKGPKGRQQEQAFNYLNEAEVQLANDYRELNESFEGAEIIDAAEQAETD